MNDFSEEISPPDFDVVVVGSGPAGCEASLAAAAAGARVLCLTINLDMVGYPPATPVLAENSGDRRHALHAEIKSLGGRLPALLEKQNVANTGDDSGCLVVDRRLLGLAWKEALEYADGLSLRQALVTHLEPCGSAWHITTGLAEEFTAAAVVVAAGTFLNGRVVDAGGSIPGGRWAEIPSHSLARSLKGLGVEFTEIWARTSPRIAAGSVESVADIARSAGSKQTTGAMRSAGTDRLAGGKSRLYPDGMQLDEIYAYELETEGNRLGQLSAIRNIDGLENAWITRTSYTVFHDVIKAGQVCETLETVGLAGLFFTGRAAGSCNYSEAAILGLVAGRAAAVHAASSMAGTSAANSDGNAASVSCGGLTGERTAQHAGEQTADHVLLELLIDRIAHKQIRPVTIRTDAESGC
ncbi:MAG: FAD-dependent oxidoreductase [Thermoleophilia bacterium]|nr:FAD-dependent oxidoreductase [Thermoleophilia bacterium]